ncbi:MAG: toll/interleukin-1 receptor domain-containing protein [Saprospiraceae bacterium]|nr:toll/interleukin-1 receptor domain-containing protein [Saprospiraceae bacterium]
MKKRSFLYHDPADQAYADALRDYFKPLEQARLLQLVSPADTPAGADQLAWIQQEIQQANIVLLLVTANLLASEFVYQDLAQWIFQRRQAGQCVIIPVIFTKCRWDLTLYGQLEPLPNKGAAIKSAYESVDEGLYDVSEGVERILNNYDQNLSLQSLEIENLKAALASFNFYNQLQPAFAPDTAGLFSVLVLKGAKQSGHQLLAWRWRTQLAQTPGTLRPMALSLTETQVSAGEIAREVHRRLAGPAHDDARSYTAAEVAALAFARLHTEPLAIRLDDFNALLQKDAVETFFRDLQSALDALLQKNQHAKPPHRLWFFVVHPFWSAAADFSLNCPAQTELPPIEPVSAPVLARWQAETDAQLSAIARHCLSDHDLFLKPDAAQNEVLDVLDRMCEAVFAKTQLYHNYLLTLE